MKLKLGYVILARHEDSPTIPSPVQRDRTFDFLENGKELTPVVRDEVFRQSFCDGTCYTADNVRFEIFKTKSDAESALLHCNIHDEVETLFVKPVYIFL